MPGSTDFAQLRSSVVELAALRAGAGLDRAVLPRLAERPGPAGDPVEAGDVLATTLAAVARASRTLRAGGVGVDAGRQPLRMSLVGDLVGVDLDTNRIYLRIEARGKGGTDG